MNSSTPPQTVAAFDFDGTISYRDTLVPFLVSVFGWARTLGGLAIVGPGLVLDYLRWRSRGQMKERLLTHFFSGLDISELRRKGSAFAADGLIYRLRPLAVKRIQWHQMQGHYCVLISASIEAYIEPWGKSMGFDDVLCTKLQTTPDGVITGHMEGGNCRGAEKTRRLKELIGDPKNATIYAYGDSAGDRELLAMADHAYYREMPDDAS